MSSLNVIVLTRDSLLVSQLTTALASISCQTRQCDHSEEMVDDVQQAKPFFAVLDFRIPSRGGHLEDRLIEELQTKYPDLELAMLTAEPCPEALERRVACTEIDRFREPVPEDELVRVIQNSIPEGENSAPKVKERIEVIPPPIEVESGNTSLHGITRKFETQTPRLSKMLVDLEIAASHDVTILLIGETGSGKTFLSQLIHEVSQRRHEPFMPIACGALPSDLIESEMFGHVKGSFTSAHADKDGKFLAAGRGTILLDEIDVLEPEQQVKLLRVIETGQFEPVGSNKTFTSQARLIVASNLDLEPLVEMGQFRPDLYYRLNMLKFEVPPLRKRKPDIIPLAKRFVEQLSEKHSTTVRKIDESLFEKLMAYPWPGNVRELENVIQRAVIYCRDGVLTEQHLPPHIVSGDIGPTNDPSVQLARNPNQAKRLGQQIAMTEQEIIEQALMNNNQSRTHAAKELGISRVTLYNKMKKYGMSKKG